MANGLMIKFFLFNTSLPTCSNVCLAYVPMCKELHFWYNFTILFGSISSHYSFLYDPI